MGLFKGLIIVRIEFDVSFFNPIQDGLFRGCSRMGGGLFGPPLSKIRHTYPTMMKLGTVIPYLRKIQKMYKSRDTYFDSCRHQRFFTGNQQILPHQEVHIRRLDFDTEFLILLTFLESLVIVLINMVTILMISAKITTPGLLKIRVF